MDMVKEIFNDFYRLLNGTRAVGLIALLEKYQKEPLFGILLSNIRLIEDIEVNEAMKEAYGIYKSFAQQDLGETELISLYDNAQTFEAKWKNLWCSQLIVAIVAMLDPDREEAAALYKEAKAGEEGENTVPSDKEDQKDCTENEETRQDDLAA